MYDIKIFLENDGTFGARINAGKDVIYGTGKDQKDLMKNMKDGLELCFQDKKKTQNVSRLFEYLKSDKKQMNGI